MEEMELQTPMTEEEVPDYDPQLLARVWARVMQGRTDGEGVGRLMPPEGQTRPTAGEPEEESRPRPRPEGTKEPVCFGPEAKRHETMLRQMLEGEWEDARIHRRLAQRAGGSAARVLSGLARQEREHAGRLGAAWFILTGQRYRWSGHNESRPSVGLAGGLREQFLQEQREAEAYARAAREVNDPCLRTLFEELARQEREHARILYGLLERM